MQYFKEGEFQNLPRIKQKIDKYFQIFYWSAATMLTCLVVYVAIVSGLV